MLTLNSKPSQLISKFKLRAGIILLILGTGILTLGILGVRHTRGNVLLHEEIVRRIQSRMDGVRGASFDSRGGREFQRLNEELAFFEIQLTRCKGYFTQAILILVGGVLVSSTGFCLVYLHRRNRRRLVFAETCLQAV